MNRRNSYGYDVISNRITWDILSENLPVLRAEIDGLLAEPDDPDGVVDRWRSGVN